jgi:hypothetical protein
MYSQLTAARAIANKMTMGAVQQALWSDEMTAREYERYLFAWSWSASRFSGSAAVWQDDYAARHGSDHLHKRMDQIKRIALSVADADSRRLLAKAGKVVR